MSYQIEYLVIGGLLSSFVLLLVAPFAMLALAIVLVLVAATVLALLAGIVVAPFYAFRTVRRRLAERRGERVHAPEDHAAYRAARATAGSAS